MWKELERESEESRNLGVVVGKTYLAKKEHTGLTETHMYDEDTQLKMETTAVTSS
jgi:hypothetical protein